MEASNIVVALAIYEAFHLIALCWIIGKLTNQPLFHVKKENIRD